MASTNVKKRGGKKKERNLFASYEFRRLVRNTPLVMQEVKKKNECHFQ